MPEDKLRTVQLCDMRHYDLDKLILRLEEKTDRNWELLVSLAGPDGKNGKLGEWRKEISSNTERSLRNERAVIKVGTVIGVIVGLASVGVNILMKFM